MMSKQERRFRELHRHHRRPRSIGGSNRDFNISLVGREKHSAWHQNFKNWEAEQIAEHINEVWLDTDFKFICVRKEEYDAVKKFLKQSKGGVSVSLQG